MLSDTRGSPDGAMAVGAVGVMFCTPLAFYFYAEMGGVWSYVLGCAPVGGFLGLYIGPMTWWMSTQVLTAFLLAFCSLLTHILALWADFR